MKLLLAMFFPLISRIEEFRSWEMVGLSGISFGFMLISK